MKKDDGQNCDEPQTIDLRDIGIRRCGSPKSNHSGTRTFVLSRNATLQEGSSECSPKNSILVGTGSWPGSYEPMRYCSPDRREVVVTTGIPRPNPTKLEGDPRTGTSWLGEQRTQNSHRGRSRTNRVSPSRLTGSFSSVQTNQSSG